MAEVTYYPPFLDEECTISITGPQALVFTRVMRGATNATIARDLFLSVDTVKSHLRKVMGKADVTDRAALIAAVYSGSVRVLIPE